MSTITITPKELAHVADFKHLSDRQRRRIYRKWREKLNVFDRRLTVFEAARCMGTTESRLYSMIG